MRKLFIAPLMLVLAGAVQAQDQAPDNSQSVPVAQPPKKSPAERRADELDRVFGRLKKSDATAEERIWELWLQSDSQTADLLLGQATLAIREQAAPEGLAILDQMVQSYPNYAEAYNKRAAVHFLMRNYDKALSDISKVLELEPRHFGALTGRGLIYLQQDKEREALLSLREALAINPTLEVVAFVVKQLERKAPDI